MNGYSSYLWKLIIAIQYVPNTFFININSFFINVLSFVSMDIWDN